jgi:hypothetical protein
MYLPMSLQVSDFSALTAAMTVQNSLKRTKQKKCLIFCHFEIIKPLLLKNLIICDIM